MSDKANKQKPKEERLARMEGVTTFRDLRDGFISGTGGAVDVTDQDVMAALAMSRARDDKGKPIADDIGPEVLQCYYGSSVRHRVILVKSYLRHNPHPRESEAELIARRLSTALAVQLLAGAMFTRQEWAEYAFLAHMRRDRFEGMARDALTWFYDEIRNAEPRFRAALENARLGQREAAAEIWDAMRNARDRDERIAGKLARK